MQMLNTVTFTQTLTIVTVNCNAFFCICLSLVLFLPCLWARRGLSCVLVSVSFEAVLTTSQLYTHTYTFNICTEQSQLHKLSEVQ